MKRRRIAKREPRLDIELNGFRLDFSERTYVMGILNVTPDSFSDGGRFFNRKAAVRRALEMERDGADIIDIGGESTRPGSRDVDAAEEAGRIITVIEAVAGRINIPVSVDTRKSKVAELAIRSGARIINDVSGLKNDGKMASVAAKYNAALIVMHMKGSPRDMQESPAYRDVVNDIIKSLEGSLAIARRAGVSEDKIIIDPGIGFGKTVGHNLEILNRLGEFKSLGRPICVGTSRKSFIGKVLDAPDTDQRLTGTLVSSAIAIMHGANLIRVHDVKETCEAVRMADSILRR